MNAQHSHHSKRLAGPRFANLRSIMSPSHIDAQPRPSMQAPKAGKQTRRVKVDPVDPVAAVRAEERQRVRAVFASDAIRGREMAAAFLLANTNMSAARIVSMAAKTPANKAAQDGFRQQLRNAPSGAAAEPNHGWAKIHEQLRSMGN